MLHKIDKVILREGKNVSRRDLEATRDALPLQGFEPCLTTELDARGAPAVGHVTALKIVGNQLVATIETAHDVVAHAIRKGAKLSVSLFHQLKRGGREFKRALKAIYVPGIPGPLVHLKPSGTMEFEDHSGAMVHCYQLDDIDDAVDTDDKPFNDLTAGEQVDRLAKAHVEDAGGTYADAVVAVCSENPELKNYAMDDWTEDPEAVRQQAGIRIQKLVHKLLEANPSIGQSQALRLVLEQHPDLAAAYRDNADQGGLGRVSI